MSVRILVADDHFVARHALRTVITQRQDWQVCGEAIDGADAVALAKSLRPDVVILDLVMKGLNGVDAAQEIGYESPTTILLTTSLYDARPIIPRLQSAGVCGFVPKSRIGIDLIPAVEAVLKGRTWFRF